MNDVQKLIHVIGRAINAYAEIEAIKVSEQNGIRNELYRTDIARQIRHVPENNYLDQNSLDKLIQD